MKREVLEVTLSNTFDNEVEHGETKESALFRLFEELEIRGVFLNNIHSGDSVISLTSEDLVVVLEEMEDEGMKTFSKEELALILEKSRVNIYRWFYETELKRIIEEIRAQA